VTDLLDACRGHGTGTWDKAFAAPDAPEHPPRDRTFLLHHVRLDIDIDDREKTVSGTVTHRLSPINDGLREITLDAADLMIRRIVDSEGKALEWEQHGETLTIRLVRARRAGDVFEISAAEFGLPLVNPLTIGKDKKIAIKRL